MKRAIYVHGIAAACALGDTYEGVQRNLLTENPRPVSGSATLIGGRVVPTGALPFPLSEMADPDRGMDSRCNTLVAHCLMDLKPVIAERIDAVGSHRVAAVIGTSTSGVRELEQAVRGRLQNGAWPPSYRFASEELSDTARQVTRLTGARGPCYGVSTACTSGAKALAAAARLIEAGLCDVAIAGGIDLLCALTLNGFGALESLSETVSNPFSANRRGINLGEGGAIFILSSVPSGLRLAGWGESADAYHISSPHPEGEGAEAAMRRALARASLEPKDIGYLNLHGTGTKLNDSMEAKAVFRVFGDALPCSSTKPMTGHMLGAAGACEAAFAAMALQSNCLPVHLWDGQRDKDLQEIRLVSRREIFDGRRAMSCSYAFGGNNIALILEKA